MRAPSVTTGLISIFHRLVLLAAFLTGCATPPVAPPTPVDPDASLPMPLAMSEFVIDPKHDEVIGELQVIRARQEDTLSDIARRFNVGYEEIVAANPGVDPWLPKAGTDIVIPSQWVLPNVQREGIVINLAAMRLFYFPAHKKNEPQRVITHPVGIGRIDWNTPQGKTRVVSKTEAPTWIPTAAIRKEHEENGDPLPASIPPGPNNPMGTHVLRLGWPEYAIHGTDKPASIGLRGTHGCLRMYPEDISTIYQQVPVGTQVAVINEPFLAGFRDDTLMLQTYPVLEDDKRNHAPRINAQLKQARALHLKKAGHTKKSAARDALVINQIVLKEMTLEPRALTMPVSVFGTSIEQLLAQAPRVKNRVPVNANWDGIGDVTMAQMSAAVYENSTSGNSAESGAPSAVVTPKPAAVAPKHRAAPARVESIFDRDL